MSLLDNVAFSEGVLMCCAALAHQNDFDVCWTKGSVAELIFTPLVRCAIPTPSACLCTMASEMA